MSLNRSQRRAQAKTLLVQQPSSSSSLSGILEVGLRHQRAGQLAQAKALYIQVLKVNPSQADALHLLGLIAHQVGQHKIAIETISRAIEIEPKVALYRCSLGNALKALGRLDEAVSAYSHAIRCTPHFAEAHYNLGTVLMALGRIDDAAGAYGTAIGLKSDFAEAHFNLGLIMLHRGQPAKASSAYRNAIRCKPDYAEAHGNLGRALQDLGQPEEALAAYDDAIRLKPDYAEAHSNRGNVLKALGRPEAAAAAHGMAIRLKPDFAESHYNLGNTLKALGRSDEAIDAYHHAIRFSPGFAEAHVNLGMELLLAGDLPQGWAEYDWRLRGASRHLQPRQFAKPQWRGESLNGRRILLHAEQGLGDTIQFCRYVPLLAARGACVTLEVPRPLLRLLSGLHGVTHLIATGDTIPDFDVQCSLMSLPLAFETRIDTIPARPGYLAAKPETTSRWRARLGPPSRRRVGLVWSGGHRPDQPELADVNQRRNIPFQVIGQLNHPDIDFFSLQKGEPAESEAVALGDALWPDGNFTNASPDLQDFDDTAGLIENLDLVISVDTSTAHLAAAMGKPVWLLNRFDSCWRWLENRDDSPWYPTLRLFRQTERGDWHSVMTRVAQALLADAKSVVVSDTGSFAGS
jgi:tetratricopeptide (TPR) repeat protein